MVRVEGLGRCAESRTRFEPPTKDWLGLVVLAFAVLLIAVDGTVLDLALPFISADLDAEQHRSCCGSSTSTRSCSPACWSRWARSATGSAAAKLLLIGAVGFGLASVLAALSVSPEMLIAARVLQGISGATLMPATLGLIRTIFVDPASAHHGHRRLGRDGRRRRCRRPAGRRMAARALLVGLGVPDQRPGHDRAGRARAVHDSRNRRTRTRADSTWSALALSIATMIPIVYAVKESVVHGPSIAAGGDRGSSVLVAGCVVRPTPADPRRTR